MKLGRSAEKPDCVLRRKTLFFFGWWYKNNNNDASLGGGANESCGLTCRLQVAGHFWFEPRDVSVLTV